MGIEKANPPRGGDAKSWISQSDAYSLGGRQTAEVLVASAIFFLMRRRFLNKFFKSYSLFHVTYILEEETRP